MKTKTLLIAAVMFFALSVSAFAQASFEVSTTGGQVDACCGLAEPTGDIKFAAAYETQTSVTGTITIRYTLPIANTTALGVSSPVIVAAYDTTGGGSVLLPTQPTVTATNDPVTGVGIVVIGVPAGYNWPYSIILSNVRVNVSGNCGGTNNVTATASSVGNFLTNGQTTSLIVVGLVTKPLMTPLVTIAPSGSTISINAGTGAVTGTATITVSEAFLTAFGNTSTFPDPTKSQETLIRLTVSPIPSGVSITFPGTAGIFETASASGVVNGLPVTLSASTSSQAVYYVMIAASDPSQIDSLTISPTITVVGPFPLAPSTITISAALAPIGPGPATVFPQFTDFCETQAVAFISVSGAKNTVLLVPYSTTELDYDTALTVANTTKDPGTLAMGNFLQAIPQTGKITVYFYNKDLSAPAIAPWVSTSYPSLYGLDAFGNLPPGGTFVALISEMLPDSVQPHSFAGYIFIITDFTDAHGEYFVTNFDNFTHGALMLIVNDPSNSPAGRTAEQGLNQ